MDTSYEKLQLRLLASTWSRRWAPSRRRLSATSCATSRQPVTSPSLMHPSRPSCTAAPQISVLTMSVAKHSPRRLSASRRSLDTPALPRGYRGGDHRYCRHYLMKPPLGIL